MTMQRLTLATFAVVAVMGIIVNSLGVYVTTRVITNTGNITESEPVPEPSILGVYSDYGCTHAIASVNWGTLHSSVTTQVTVYIKNLYTVTMALTMHVESWNPSSAVTYISLTWNRENYDLSAGSVVEVTLTLSVASGLSGTVDFSADIVVTGTEHT
jgi:hypothetical protein